MKKILSIILITCLIVTTFISSFTNVNAAINLCKETKNNVNSLSNFSPICYKMDSPIYFGVSVYKLARGWEIVLTIKNTGDGDLQVFKNNEGGFWFVIYNEEGESIYTSDNWKFVEFEYLILHPGALYSRGEPWTKCNDAGEKVPNGNYTVIGYVGPVWYDQNFYETLDTDPVNITVVNRKTSCSNTINLWIFSFLRALRKI